MKYHFLATPNGPGLIESTYQVKKPKMTTFAKNKIQITPMVIGSSGRVLVNRLSNWHPAPVPSWTCKT